MLVAGNDPVTAALKGVQTDGAYGHGVSQNAFRVMLAMEVSRVFDISASRPAERQDKAALPILAHAFSRPDVRAELISRASPTSQFLGRTFREWTTVGLAEFDKEWNRFMSDPDDQDALSKLRSLRDSVIAHSLIHAEPEAPTYEELFRLVAIATRLATAAEHALTAGGGYFADFRQDRRAKSEEFWAIFIRGAKA